MRAVVDLERLMRLRATVGIPLLTVIEKRLVTRDDWEEFCGAEYPSRRTRNKLWRRKRDGSLKYIGPTPNRSRVY